MTTFNSNTHLITKDFLVSGEEFHLVRNLDFGYLETRPVPSKLSAYYESEAYISHTDSNKGWLSWLYQQVRNHTLKRKRKLLNSLVEGKCKILDVGAGTGAFLEVMENDGWTINGVEPNDKARQIAKQRGLQLEGDLNQVNDSGFDVITLWHVLEHLPDLEEVKKQLTHLLKLNGILIIAVPNYNSYDAKHYGSFWAAYDTPRHLWHFSKESMRKLFSSWSLITIKPMYFDAFYVSLLSEKYRSGKSNVIRAFWTGLRSNWSARKTKEYSSLIYIFKKEK